MKVFFTFLVLILAFTVSQSSAFAQGETAKAIDVEKELALLRQDIRADKKKILAANLPLTADEAVKFWPVYDQYVAEMSKNYDEFYSVIKDYAANQKTLTDAQASSMIKRWADIQVQQAQTRKKYIPLVEKTIPGKKAALFFQIDRRLYALMDMQVAGQIPLVVQ